MRFLHGIFTLLIWVVLLASSLFLVYIAMLGPEAWKQFVVLVSAERMTAFCVGFGMNMLILLYMLTLVRRPDLRDHLSFQSDGGPITISKAAVRDIIKKLGDEFAAVSSIHPNITRRGHAVDIEVDVRVRSGTQVPELCRLLQDRIRESMRENVGISEIRDIQVNVREIIPPPTSPKLTYEEDSEF